MDINSQCSKYLVNCRAVFQGGGCKAVAFIGAYQEALSNGIGFSEFAGTSAGSIIAALIAAGATPKQLEDIISTTDFKQFANTLSNQKQLWWVRLVYKVFKWLIKNKLPEFRYFSAFLSIYSRLGYYDSSSIRKFVDKELKKLLKLDREVRFSDLKYPLTIVASDIKIKTIKIWNKKDTLEAPVAYAVQCSCAVPFIYHAVDGRYVDGGLLCNLPVIVFEQNEVDYDKILAFTFKNTMPKKTERPILKYSKQLIATVVDGAVSIQSSFKKNLLSIPIYTDLELFDFEKLSKSPKKLSNAIFEGKIAVKSFVKAQEYEHNYHSNTMDTSFNRKEQVRALVSYRSYQKNERVVVSYCSLEWSWELFLTLLKWKNDGTQIDVYTEGNMWNDPKNKEKEKARIRTLCYMGIKVYVCAGTLPVYGYFFCRNKRWTGVVINVKGTKFNAKYYDNDVDCRIIELLECALAKSDSREIKTHQINNIKLESVDEAEIIQRLGKISHYEHKSLNFEDVEVEKVRFMTPYVLGYKYRSIDVLINLYCENSIYGAAAFRFAEQKLSYIGPPVVELWDNDCVIINGNTRFLHAYKHGVKKIRAVVVRDVTTPLMSEARFKASEVVVTDKTVKGETRYDSNWDYAKFRPIESAVRPYRSYLIN